MCQSFLATLHRHDIDNPLCITIRRRSPNQVRATETAHRANVNSIIIATLQLEMRRAYNRRHVAWNTAAASIQSTLNRQNYCTCNDFAIRTAPQIAWRHFVVALCYHSWVFFHQIWFFGQLSGFQARSLWQCRVFFV